MSMDGLQNDPTQQLLNFLSRKRGQTIETEEIYELINALFMAPLVKALGDFGGSKGVRADVFSLLRVVMGRCSKDPLKFQKLTHVFSRLLDEQFANQAKSIMASTEKRQFVEQLNAQWQMNKCIGDALAELFAIVDVSKYSGKHTDEKCIEMAFGKSETPMLPLRAVVLQRFATCFFAGSKDALEGVLDDYMKSTRESVDDGGIEKHPEHARTLPVSVLLATGTCQMILFMNMCMDGALTLHAGQNLRQLEANTALTRTPSFIKNTEATLVAKTQAFYSRLTSSMIADNVPFRAYVARIWAYFDKENAALSSNVVPVGTRNAIMNALRKEVLPQEYVRCQISSAIASILRGGTDGDALEAIMGIVNMAVGMTSNVSPATLETSSLDDAVDAVVENCIKSAIKNTVLSTLQSIEALRQARADGEPSSGSGASKKIDTQFGEDVVNAVMRATQISSQALKNRAGLFGVMTTVLEMGIDKHAQGLAAVLASMLNALLRGCKTVTDEPAAELQAQKILTTATFLLDQDVFIEFCRSNAAARCLSGKMGSRNAEHNVLEQMKCVFGQVAVTSLCRMVQDFTFAEEPPFEIEGVEVRRRVLRMSLWPQLPILPAAILPPELSVLCAKVQDHYVGGNPEHSGRELQTIHGYGFVEMVTTFPEGGTKTITMTLLQAAVVFLLQNTVDQSATVADIRCGLGLSLGTVQPILGSMMARPSILCKDSAKKSISDTDVISVSTKCTEKLRNFSLPVPQISNDAAVVDATIQAERKFAMHAVIVRLMKARKTLSEQALIAEAKTQIVLAKRFCPTDGDVKTAIAKLTQEPAYLVKSTEDDSVYNYVAS